jgi:hypothetical protein
VEIKKKYVKCKNGPISPKLCHSLTRKTGRVVNLCFSNVAAYRVIEVGAAGLGQLDLPEAVASFLALGLVLRPVLDLTLLAAVDGLDTAYKKS